MINSVKDKEKEIPPEKLKEYKRRAALLAAAYGLERERYCWWIDIDGDVRLIIHDPNEDMERWLQDRIDKNKGKD